MPSEEQRKLQQIGKSFAVFLPKPWVRYNKLNKGDLLTIISDEDVVIKLVKRATPQDNKPDEIKEKAK